MHEPPLCNLVWVPCVRSQKRTRLLRTNPSTQLVGPNAVRCNGPDEKGVGFHVRVGLTSNGARTMPNRHLASLSIARNF